MWKMFSQNALSAGSISPKVAASAPTMVLSRPCSASTGVPGQRRIDEAHTPGLEFAGDFQRRTGWLVEVSTTTCPGRADSRMPPFR